MTQCDSVFEKSFHAHSVKSMAADLKKKYMYENGYIRMSPKDSVKLSECLKVDGDKLKVVPTSQSELSDRCSSFEELKM